MPYGIHWKHCRASSFLSRWRGQNRRTCTADGTPVTRDSQPSADAVFPELVGATQEHDPAVVGFQLTQTDDALLT